ncbi:MAG TPA: hypothetical protein VIM69_03525 [Opitutaceae bacterium]
MDTVPPPPTTPAAAATAEASPSDDKTVAIITYLHVIGFIIALVMRGNRRSPFVAFHLRQMLGLLIVWVCCWFLFVIPFLGWFTAPFLFLGLFVLWIIGFIGALNGATKPVPVLGASFQKWFGNAFN